jgi:hypothetical protein
MDILAKSRNSLLFGSGTAYITFVFFKFLCILAMPLIDTGSFRPSTIERASGAQVWRKFTADSISSGVVSDNTPNVRCNEPVGRIMLGWIVEGSFSLNAVTLLRKAGDRRGKHMKCVNRTDLRFIVANK